MDIIYYKDPIGNFGDDLNEWIWDELNPIIRLHKSRYSLLGIGSIINKNLIKNKDVIIFSSGAGYGTLPSTKNLKIACVRGKLTAKIMNIDESYAIADGAILLNLISDFSPISIDKRDGIIFIPHHITFIENDGWQKICNNAGIELVDPTSNSKDVIQKIRHSKLVIAEAMHAAIIADAMRVNWIPVVAGCQINTFKWLDWLSVFNIPYEPTFIGLPDFNKSRYNDLLIENNIFLCKKDYKKMSIKDLLTVNYKKIAFKINDETLKTKVPFTNTFFSNLHKSHVSKQLSQLKNFDGYLSNEKIFQNNLNFLTKKLNEVGIPLISIIISAYNTAHEINKILLSVEKQTYPNYEIVIINDGSTDGTKELLDNYKINKSNITVFHQENKGVSAARNKGIELSKGEFICFLDSDDTYHPQFLEKMINRQLETNGNVIIYCGYQYLNSKNEITYKFSPRIEGNILYDFFMPGEYFRFSGILIKQEVLFNYNHRLDSAMNKKWNDEMYLFEISCWQECLSEIKINYNSEGKENIITQLKTQIVFYHLKYLVYKIRKLKLTGIKNYSDKDELISFGKLVNFQKSYKRMFSIVTSNNYLYLFWGAIYYGIIKKNKRYL